MTRGSDSAEGAYCSIEPVKMRRSRHTLYGLAAAAAILVGGGATAWVLTSGGPAPDPGGRILATLESSLRAIPTSGVVNEKDLVEPECAPDFGRRIWSQVVVFVQFQDTASAQSIVAGFDGKVTSEGWDRDGALAADGGRWKRRLEDGASATLSLVVDGGPGQAPGTWTMQAIAPPAVTPC